MLLPKIFTDRRGRGFTLVEVILVVAIVILILGYTMSSGIAQIRRISLQDDVYTFILRCLTARYKAILNYGGVSQSISYGGNQYYVGDVLYSLSPNISFDANDKISFQQLTGFTDHPSTTIRLRSPYASKSIEIGPRGEFVW